MARLDLKFLLAAADVTPFEPKGLMDNGYWCGITLIIAQTFHYPSLSATFETRQSRKVKQATYGNMNINMHPKTRV